MSGEETVCMRCRQALPWFAASTIDANERAFVEQHVKTCSACARELEQWQAISGAICNTQHVTPVIPYTHTWQAFRTHLTMLDRPAHARHVARQSIQGKLKIAVLGVRDTIRMQCQLLPTEFWVIQAGIGALLICMLLLPLSLANRVNTLFYGTTLLTTISAVILYHVGEGGFGELISTLPRSTRLLFLLRLGLAMGVAALIQTCVLLPLLAIHAIDAPVQALASWLAPLGCLLAIALLLATVLHTLLALVLSLFLWLLHGFTSLTPFVNVPLLQHYEGFWHHPPALLLVMILALFCTYLANDYRERFAR